MTAYKRLLACAPVLLIMFAFGIAPRITSADVVITNYPAPSGNPQYHQLASDGRNLWVAQNGIGVTKVSSTGTVLHSYVESDWTPFRIAFDGTNMWTADAGDTGGLGNVSKITPSSVITHYTGTGTTPMGIAFDGTNMWTANADDNSVTKVAPDGTMTTYSGTGAAPISLAFDGTNMWTVNSRGNSVTKVAPDGTMTTFTGLPVDSEGYLSVDITFDGTNMWTANQNGTVTKISPSGTMTTYSGAGITPDGIAFDGTNIWVTNPGDGSVTQVTPSGVMTNYTGVGETSAGPGGPVGIMFDGTNLWAASALALTKINPFAASTTTTTTTTTGTGGGTGGGTTTTSVVAPTMFTDYLQTGDYSMTTAKIKGHIVNMGGSTSVTTSLTYWTGTTAPTTIATGTLSTLGAFSTQISGLACNTEYSVYATGTNSAGSANGPVIGFTTTPCPGVAPSVSTNPATLVTATSAVFNGNLQGMGSASSVNVGFDYGIGNLDTHMSLPQARTTIGMFTNSSTITNLTCASTYSVRANAASAYGTSYGPTQTFMTSACVPVTPVVTPAVTNTTTTTPAASTGTTASVSISSGPVALPTVDQLSTLPSLSVGKTGDAVLTLQSYLYVNKLLPVAPTGYYGMMTKAAVTEFQKQNGVDAIGVFGPRTRNALLLSAKTVQ